MKRIIKLEIEVEESAIAKEYARLVAGLPETQELCDVFESRIDEEDKWNEIGTSLTVTKVTMDGAELSSESNNEVRGLEEIWCLIDNAEDDCGPMLVLQYTRS